MANITKWKRRIPRWEGNADDPAPFAIEVKRLSVDERTALRLALVEVRAGGPTIGAVLGSVVRGPIGDLAFDGEPFRGSIGELIDRLLVDDPIGHHSLVDEIVRLIAEVNGIDAGG